MLTGQGGRFELTWSGWLPGALRPFSVVAADLNVDGREDVAVARPAVR